IRYRIYGRCCQCRRACSCILNPLQKTAITTEDFCFILSGNLDKACFDQAWDFFVVQRHEMLRVFRWKETKQPVQLVLHKSMSGLYSIWTILNNRRRKRNSSSSC
ncbi:MAG: hypothetical protein ACLR23_14375, partial [Clostridia bacterium]